MVMGYSFRTVFYNITLSYRVLHREKPKGQTEEKLMMLDYKTVSFPFITTNLRGYFNIF